MAHGWLSVEVQQQMLQTVINYSQSAVSRAVSRTLRLGFVPLTDCAPLVVAKELGFFKRYGVNVTLQRELGWASIRDKVIYGELDAAHAVASMPIAATLGLGSIPCECITALVLNLHGNGITLSNELRRRGVKDGETLRLEVQRSKGRKLTFGVVYPFSSHRHLLRRWMQLHNIDPDKDVNLVVVPPAHMVANLKAGHLDGFCVGEPWNSIAVHAHVGWCVAVSAELAPGHPEKVLMVRRDFAEKRESEHLAIVSALIDACAFCDATGNQPQVLALCSRPEYVGESISALMPGISGKFDFGFGIVRSVPEFCVFHRKNANEPSDDKAAWATDVVRASGLCPDEASVTLSQTRRIFRPDIFDKAVNLAAAA